jgi:hypothetical protein
MRIAHGIRIGILVVAVLSMELCVALVAIARKFLRMVHSDGIQITTSSGGP